MPMGKINGELFPGALVDCTKPCASLRFTNYQRKKQRYVSQIENIMDLLDCCCPWPDYSGQITFILKHIPLVLYFEMPISGIKKEEGKHARAR